MTTKIHMLVDALGRPLRFILTGGHINDCTQAALLLENASAGAILADKGYDTDKILETIQQLGAVAVIPPKSNRKIQPEYNRELYKQRNLIERSFNRLKNCSFLYLAAFHLWA